MPIGVEDIVADVPEYSDKELTIVGYDTLADISRLSSRTYAFGSFAIHFLEGELRFADVPEHGRVELVDGVPAITFGQMNFGQVRASNWIVFLIPKSLRPEHEQIATIEGYVRLVFGRNSLDHQVFKQQFAAGQHTLSSAVVMNPFFRIAFPFSEQNLGSLQFLEKLIDSGTLEAQDRLKRSLGWYTSAVSSNGVDSFLRIWIAIEMLFTNSEYVVNELAKKVAEAYKIEAVEAKEKFQLGKLFGLRSLIVHRGSTDGFNDAVVDVLSFLYFDLLVFELNKEHSRRAEEFLSAKSTTMKELLK